MFFSACEIFYLMLLIGKLDALRLRGTDKDLNYIVAGFEPTDLD